MPARARTNGQGSPYDHTHRKRRAAMVRAALGTPCPARYSRNCTGLMTNPRLMHLDHSTPLALGGVHGDRIICAPCNTSAGATLGNRLRGARRHPRRRLPAW